MDPFDYYCPTRVVFGPDRIVALSELIPRERRVLMVYGGGSIKRNGVYDAVLSTLARHTVVEFGGIQPNPEYETCLAAVEQLRAESCDFILAVGGGSVLDACKFIAAAARYDGTAWDLLEDNSLTADALPVGAVLTLPATGSEMNPNAVISRAEIEQKRALIHPLLYPQFSILDPTTTLSLPERQTANGIVDAFVHTTEQYITRMVDAPLQDRQAEAILLTLIEQAPKVMADPSDLSARSNIMWAATNALNGLISCGTPQDWATHQIGHELTALYHLDHARTLAVVQPGVWEHCFAAKREKLAHYAWRVWGCDGMGTDAAARAAIARTEEFYHSLGIGTTLADHDIPAAACDRIAARLGERGVALGEDGAITGAVAGEILRLRIGGD